ncbi:MAG: hypothetical protein ABIB79_00915 [archaeon]
MSTRQMYDLLNSAVIGKYFINDDYHIIHISGELEVGERSCFFPFEDCMTGESGTLNLDLTKEYREIDKPDVSNRLKSALERLEKVP